MQHSLDLSQNYIGPSQIKKLSEGLVNSKLTQLILSGNAITSDPASELINKAENTELKHLDLGDNGIDDSFLLKIINSIEKVNITHLDLRNNKIDLFLTFNELRNFFDKSNITYLNLESNSIDINESLIKNLQTILPGKAITELKLFRVNNRFTLAKDSNIVNEILKHNKFLKDTIINGFKSYIDYKNEESNQNELGFSEQEISKEIIKSYIYFTTILARHPNLKTHIFNESNTNFTYDQKKNFLHDIQYELAKVINTTGKFYNDNELIQLCKNANLNDTVEQLRECSNRSTIEGVENMRLIDENEMEITGDHAATEQFYETEL